jgi:preprotein translocase subunit SecD
MRRTMTGAFRLARRAGLILVAGIVALLSSTPPIPLGAQQQGCVSFHEVHAQITAQEALQTGVPAGYQIYSFAGSKNKEKHLLHEIPFVRGGEMSDAQASFDGRTGEPVISFRLNPEGAGKLLSFTRNNVGRPFAIVLDNQVISSPVIREPIREGTGQISGNFTSAQAQQLATNLKSGTCP